MEKDPKQMILNIYNKEGIEPFKKLSKKELWKVRRILGDTSNYRTSVTKDSLVKRIENIILEPQRKSERAKKEARAKTVRYEADLIKEYLTKYGNINDLETATHTDIENWLYCAKISKKRY